MAPRRTVGWTAVLAVGGLLCAAVLLSGGWLGRRVVVGHDLRAWAIDRVLDGSGVRLRTGSVTVDTEDWRVRVDDVAVASPRGSLKAARVGTDVPGLWSALVLGRVDLGLVEVTDLRLERIRGLDPPAAPSGSTKLVLDRLRVRSGTLVLPALAEAGLPRTEVSGIDIDLRGVVVKLGQGMVRGSGTLTVDRWKAGPVQATQVRVDAVSVDGPTIHLDQGRFAFGGGAGAGSVDLTQRPGAVPLVHAELEVKQVRLERFIELATGSASPLTGELAGRVDVLAGEVPGRLGATTRLDAKVENGGLVLGPKVSPALKRALKVAPFLKVKGDRVLLGPIQANLVLQPGRVRVDQLVHQGEARALAAKGTVAGRQVDLVVRLLPRRRAEERAGFGIVVTGEAGKLEVRRAQPDELRGVGP